MTKEMKRYIMSVTGKTKQAVHDNDVDMVTKNM